MIDVRCGTVGWIVCVQRIERRNFDAIEREKKRSMDASVGQIATRHIQFKMSYGQPGASECHGQLAEGMPVIQVKDINKAKGK